MNTKRILFTLAGTFVLFIAFAQKFDDKGTLSGSIQYSGSAVKTFSISDDEDNYIYLKKSETAEESQRKTAVAALTNAKENSDLKHKFQVSFAYVNSGATVNFKTLAYTTGIYVPANITPFQTTSTVSGSAPNLTTTTTLTGSSTQLMLKVIEYSGKNFFTTAAKITVTVTKINLHTPAAAVLSDGVSTTYSINIPCDASGKFKGEEQQMLIATLPAGKYEVKIAFDDCTGMNEANGKFNGTLSLELIN